MNGKERLILALDTPGTKEGLALLDRLKAPWMKVKVGPRLFALGGETFLRDLQERGHRVFLDLKLHDIPNTVAQAVEVYARWGLWALTVHTSGGETMMRRAREAAGTDLLLLGVTVLTSLDGPEWEAVHPGCSLERALSGRAALARARGGGRNVNRARKHTPAPVHVRTAGPCGRYTCRLPSAAPVPLQAPFPHVRIR